MKIYMLTKERPDFRATDWCLTPEVPRTYITSSDDPYRNRYGYRSEIVTVRPGIGEAMQFILDDCKEQLALVLHDDLWFKRVTWFDDGPYPSDCRGSIVWMEIMERYLSQYSMVALSDKRTHRSRSREGIEGGVLERAIAFDLNVVREEGIDVMQWTQTADLCLALELLTRGYPGFTLTNFYYEPTSDGSVNPLKRRVRDEVKQFFPSYVREDGTIDWYLAYERCVL
jgi:hypothetical protein